MLCVFYKFVKELKLFVLSKIKQKCVFYEIDIERHRVRLMAYENRNAAYDLSLFDDSSDYVRVQPLLKEKKKYIRSRKEKEEKTTL